AGNVRDLRFGQIGALFQPIDLNVGLAELLGVPYIIIISPGGSHCSDQARSLCCSSNLDSDEVDLKSRLGGLLDGGIDIAAGVVLSVRQNNHDLAQAFSAPLFLLLGKIQSGQD